MTSAVDTHPALAAELRVVLGTLVRRLRAESSLPITQASVLARLADAPRRSIGELAALERVRPQSMAQVVAEIERAGLVRRLPDPEDGRRVLLQLTATGQRTVRELRRSRDDWLGAAMADSLTPTERRSIERALPALRKLAHRD